MEINQIYRNTTETPIETVFTMPISDTFSLTRIEITFFDEKGNLLDEIETDVYERKEAWEKYKTAIKDGETATISETTGKNITIYLGNFPPKTKAHLRAYCSQKLEC